METVKTIAKRTAALVLLADIIHVYSYLNNYYKDDDFEGTYDDERLYEDEKVIQAYAGDCTPESCVSDAEYRKGLADMMAELEKEPVESGLYPMGHVAQVLNRESIVFAGAGRATFMQLAHPFIAAGIRQHSMLENGVSRRFYNTFKYMFGMTFGTREEIERSSKAVRGLHFKVFGEIREDVGVFTAQSRFTAAEKNALRFVAASLLETSVFEYEMHVRLLPEEEKDELVRAGSKLLMLFGVRPTDSDPKTWAEFRRHMSALFRSKVLTASETAKDTTEFLMLPPTPVYQPLLDTVRWSTAVSLPPRLAKQYTGRTPNWLDKVFFSIFHGLVRFMYRLTPASWRYLAAYWRMYDRVNPGKRSHLSLFISKCAAKFTGGFLVMAMPERDPEQTSKLVQEKRAKRVQFEKIPGSPLKVSH